MAKKLIIQLSLEDEDNWRDSVNVRRVLTAKEFEHLREGPQKYVEAEAGIMWRQLKVAEEERHG